ncbi:hypothetical protein predicted by Glimmer/Critica [Sorangium cellulosum So ce56]|uniref:Uncharacterized protein n=1 Tax=Sorangium cellulosum (strain So ce56) TaxID=448385 RepID=A9FZ33_SORC5|nr:hypothetical protein [Sorangium cellulosum]CAN98705.1 hypothetical protein predicted by Glimmer/Critica [Sorangium cellulosum So ce56]
MPKVTFVNEHRTVEAAPGRLLSDIAAELGIAVCREAFRGTGIGDYTCWVKGEPGATSPPTFLEKLLGARGQRRMANRTRVLGDVQVWTQAGPGNRLRAPRPIAPPPSPATDPEAPRKPIDASGSAAFPYGDPRAVGHGKREPIAAGALEAKAAKEKKAKAAPAKAAEGAAPEAAAEGAASAAVKAPKAAAKAPKEAAPDAAKAPEATLPEPAAKAPEAAAKTPEAAEAVATTPEGAVTDPAANAMEIATLDAAKAPEAPEPEAAAKAPEPATAAKETGGGASE